MISHFIKYQTLIYEEHWFYLMQSHYLLHYFSIFCPIRIVRYSIWNYCCKDFGKVKMIVLGLILIIGQKKCYLFLWFRPHTPKLLYYHKTYWKSIMRKKVSECLSSILRAPSYICNIDHIITLRIEYVYKIIWWENFF